MLSAFGPKLCALSRGPGSAWPSGPLKDTPSWAVSFDSLAPELGQNSNCFYFLFILHHFSFLSYQKQSTPAKTYSSDINSLPKSTADVTEMPIQGVKLIKCGCSGASVCMLGNRTVVYPDVAQNLNTCHVWAHINQYAQVFKCALCTSGVLCPLSSLSSAIFASPFSFCLSSVRCRSSIRPSSSSSVLNPPLAYFPTSFCHSPRPARPGPAYTSKPHCAASMEVLLAEL